MRLAPAILGVTHLSTVAVGAGFAGVSRGSALAMFLGKQRLASRRPEDTMENKKYDQRIQGGQGGQQQHGQSGQQGGSA